MKYRLEIPQTIEQAYITRKNTNGFYLAAGTVLLIQKLENPVLIALEKIPGLDCIEQNGNEITIGCNVTIDNIDNSALIREKAYALWQSAHNIAGPQIRNRATIGGNIACFSPASDTVPALMTLDASVTYYDGEFKTEKITDLKPFENGEIIHKITIPCTGAKSVYEKVGKRNASSVSVLNMAIAKSNTVYRIAVGSAGPGVVFCTDPDKVLSLISPIDDRWGTKEYKRTVCRNLLDKLIREVDVQ